jgi:uncharacterized protein
VPEVSSTTVDLSKEIALQPCLTKPTSDVVITVEVQAEDPQGFDEATQRAVRKNCATLKFRNGELEAE